MDAEKLQQFFDYKEIVELKARFGRLADVKDWDGFKDVFSADATFDLGNGQIMQGSETYVSAVRGMLEGAVSLHRFSMPEITFLSANEAAGIWVIHDYNVWPSDPVTGERCGYNGHGREYETYRKIAGAWKITSWRLRYDRLDPLPREPLPAFILGGPDALRDEAYIAAVVNPARGMTRRRDLARIDQGGNLDTDPPAPLLRRNLRPRVAGYGSIIMDRADTEERIAAIIAPFNTKGVTISDGSTFTGDLELDSLTVMDFVAAIEDEFDIIISMNQQASIENYGQLVDAVTRLRG